MRLGAVLADGAEGSATRFVDRPGFWPVPVADWSGFRPVAEGLALGCPQKEA